MSRPLLVPIAHAGHWLPYVIPAALVLVAVIVSSVREHRRRVEGDAEQDEGPVDDETR